MITFIEQIKSIRDIQTATKLLYSLIEKKSSIEKALELIFKYHENQFRKSGEPYVIHPILVASLVAHYGGDEQMVIAALLHDIIEDTDCTIKTIEKNFDKNVTLLVEALTKIVELRDEKLAPSSSNERLISSALTYRKMLLASINDVRVLVIKLCDRLHNMLTLDALTKAKQKRISEETLVVYVPIAHRLGISTIKNQLEDLSFYFLLPKEYKKIDEYLTKHDQQLQLTLNNFISKITQLMLKNGFIDGEFSIHKRIKHHYSIYLKMQRKGISMEEVLDLMAVRIFVKNPIDCYRAIGVIHLNFKPLISRFKDYVSIPKDNGYQTIHTTVFDDQSIIEAQVRTYDMHKTAELGVAAHWKYKGYDGLSPKLEWLHDMKLQGDSDKNIEEMYELIKDDLYSEDISVFSPLGELFTLPRRATVLDFAYAVHTDIGNHAKTALVNKQKTPLLTELKNADIVKIITSKELQVRCSWIPSMKTAKAKDAMRLNCKQKLKELNTKTGINILLGIFNIKYKLLMQILEKNGILKNIHKSTTSQIHLQEDIYHVRKLINKVRKFPLFKSYKLKKQRFENIVLYSPQNYSNIVFDYCCHPKRGDDIVAFKKGSTALIHHKFCSNATKMMDELKPMVFAGWSRDKPNRYKLIVSIENKRGSLALFLQFLAKMEINLLTIELSRSENALVDFFDLIVELPEKNKDKLKDKIMQKYNIIEFAPLEDAYKQ